MRENYLWGGIGILSLLLSFPPLRFWPLAFLFPFALLKTLEQASGKRAFLFGFIVGSIFFAVHVHWILFLEVPSEIKRLLYLGFVLLFSYEAVYFALFCYFASRIKRFRLLSFPSLWIILEFLRGYGTLGFPWVPLWYSQIRNTPFIQWASVFGPYGISFVIFLVGTALYLGVFGKFSKTKGGLYIVGGVFIFIIFEFSSQFLPQFKPVGHIKVALFQPNVLPEYIGEDEWDRLKERYLELSDSLREDVDLIILSESSIPGYYRSSIRAKELFREIAREHRAPILLGSADYTRTDTGYIYYNSALLIDTLGEILESYRKAHLVPFGEWLPFEDKIKFLQRVELGQGNYTPGKEHKPIYLRNTPLGILICFESIFPEISREEIKRGAKVLVNITSDGWYGRSLGPVEHFELARFRAIETRRFLLRCARTGISAIIDSKGNVIDSLGLFKEGIVTYEAPLFSGVTPYVKFGDVILFLAVLNLLGIGVYNRWRKGQGER